MVQIGTNFEDINRLLSLKEYGEHGLTLEWENNGVIS